MLIGSRKRENLLQTTPAREWAKLLRRKKTFCHGFVSYILVDMAVTAGAFLIFTILISVTANTFSLDLFDSREKSTIAEFNSKENHVTDAEHSKETQSQFANKDRWIHNDVSLQEKSSPFHNGPWFLLWKTKRDSEGTWPKRRFLTPLRDKVPSLSAESPLSASLIRKTRGRQYDVPQIGKSDS